MGDWLEHMRSIISSPEAPGVAGALLSAKSAPGETWGARLMWVIGGLSVAWFLLPYAAELVGVASRPGLTAFGFLGGFIGMNLLAKAKDHILATPFGDLLKSLVTRKVP